jgi:outer membrane protein assembly factor BamE (lipoprotein component of BamABCDE complex)
MRKFVQKLGFIQLLICLSTTVSATINGFDPSIEFSHKVNTIHPMKVKFYANEDDLNRIAIGLKREQVRFLIGGSQLHAGIVKPNSLSYIFKFSELSKRDLVCQYQIQFDDQQLVSASYFDSQACVDHLHSPLPQATSEPSKPQSTPEISAAVTDPSS